MDIHAIIYEDLKRWITLWDINISLYHKGSMYSPVYQKIHYRLLKGRN